MFNRNPVHRIPLRRRIAELLAAAGDRLFARPDAQARVRGWQVTPAYAGLGRRYRDPRIAQLARARAHATGTAYALEAVRAER